MKNLHDLKWHFLSIYYAKDKWHLLLKEITKLNTITNGSVINFIIYLSEDKGENIKLAFSTLDNDNKIELFIHNSLNAFINNNPSNCKEETRFGEILWCNYPNNSLVWNNFTVNSFSSEDVQFEEHTSQLILKLLEEDFSQDNLFSIALLLNIKALKDYKNIVIPNLLEETICFLSSHFNQFIDSNFLTKNLLSQLEISLSEIFEILNYYWVDELESNSSLILDWLKNIRLLYENKENNYHRICCCVFNLLGVNSIEKIFLLQLIHEWFLSQDLYNDTE